MNLGCFVFCGLLAAGAITNVLASWCSSLAEPGQAHGGSPREELATSSRTSDRVIILTDPMRDQEFVSVSLNTARKILIPISTQAIGDHPVDDRPHGSTPVTQGFKVCSLWVVAGDAILDAVEPSLQRSSQSRRLFG